MPNDSGHIRSPAPAHIHHVVALCPYTYSYYSGIIMVLYGIVMVLLWYYYSIIIVLLWYYYGIIMVLLWYYYG